MTQYDDNEQEPFDDIVGTLLKCPKGVWTLGDLKLPTGPDGARATLLMTTARHWLVQWVDERPIPRSEKKRFIDCDPPRDRVPQGLNPYTIVQCIIDDQLCTFASSSWGGRRAIKPIIDQCRYLHKRQFPIVTLGSKPSGDANDNIDPAFKIVGWVPRSDFIDMFAEPDSVEALPERTAPARSMITVTSGPTTAYNPTLDDNPPPAAPFDESAYAGASANDEPIPF